jgi:hypothetical protein
MDVYAADFTGLVQSINIGLNTIFFGNDLHMYKLRQLTHKLNKVRATNKYINVPFCKKLTRISYKSSSVDFTAFTILSTNILDIDLYQNKERKTLHPVSDKIR